MIDEEQIFDILDGVASAETILQHKNLLKTSPEYVANFKEMEALHQELSKMNVEQPSAQFTANLLMKMGVATAPKKVRWTSKYVYIFAAILVSLIIFLVILLSNNTSTDDAFTLSLVKLSSFFFTGVFSRILLIINALALLLVLDKKVLKPFFEKRRMAF